jgi:hypothetical protein
MWPDLGDGTGPLTLIARITSAGNSWQFTDAGGNAGQSEGPWESASTFGSETRGDYKNEFWSTLPKSRILIVHNGEPLLWTTSDCFPGQSMQATFNGLQWDADGSQKDPSAAHRCTVDASPTADSLLVPAPHVVSYLALKFGEREGVQYGNKDRVYMSAGPETVDVATTGSGTVDTPMGLGSYCRLNGNEASNNVGIDADNSISADAGHDYEIYVS